MEIYCNGTARICHHDTGVIYEINTDELDWETADANERNMGTEFHYEAKMEHSQLGELSWSLWEYPVGAENMQQTDVGKHRIIEDFDYGLSHTPDYDDWELYDSPDDPFNIFIEAHNETTSILNTYGATHRSDLIMRMVFTQYISIMESYLADTLLNAVLNNPLATLNMIRENDDLKSKRYSLLDFEEDPQIVRNEIHRHLRDVIYHNLKKVDALYQIALGVKLLKGDWSELFKAIKIRHDCIHRNGFSKDRNRLAIFDKDYLELIGSTVKKFIKHVEIAVNSEVDAADTREFLRQKKCPSPTSE